jgi:signal transduction histidine kinase
VTLKKVKKRIQFCVSDSGMGISKEDLTHLFKKFSRGEGTSVVHTEGTGLGLYVAKEMIKALNNEKTYAEASLAGQNIDQTYSSALGLMDEAISEKIEQFLIKPVNPTQIFIACKQVLEKSKIQEEKRQTKVIY